MTLVLLMAPNWVTSVIGRWTKDVGFGGSDAIVEDLELEGWSGGERGTTDYYIMCSTANRSRCH